MQKYPKTFNFNAYSNKSKLSNASSKNIGDEVFEIFRG